MHIVIGGAFNGKRKWVRKYYENTKEFEYLKESIQELEKRLTEKQDSILVLDSIEEWTKEWLTDYSVDEARVIGRGWISRLTAWEQESEARQLVLIARDFSKGIVPIEKTDRDWRDLTGWFYQDLIEAASRVDEVWYGIGRQLK